jgi:hypothetical protein
MRFFRVTRRVLFGLIGFILTFEMILMQYDKVDVEKHDWFQCVVA